MELINCLSQVRETRSHINQSYPLLEVTFLVVVALVCKQKTWEDIEDFGEGNMEWLRNYLPYKSGIPTRHNIARIIRSTVPETLVKAMVDWVNILRKRTDNPLLAFDGKEIKGVSRFGDSMTPPVNVLSAYDVDSGMVIYHEVCEGKGKEIATLQSVLEVLDIKGALITADSLHCQRATFDLIRKKGGHALIQVKRNQPTLFEAVDAACQSYWQRPEDEQEYLETREKGHGRKEVRTVFVVTLTLTEALAKKWSHLKTVVAVARERTDKGKTVCNTAYFVCTDNLSLERAQEVTRRHWETENCQHWVLDHAFEEDSQKMYAGKIAKNMATLRRFALNILRRDDGGKKCSMPRKMNRAAFNLEYRHRILFEI